MVQFVFYSSIVYNLTSIVSVSKTRVSGWTKCVPISVMCASLLIRLLSTNQGFIVVQGSYVNWNNNSTLSS